MEYVRFGRSSLKISRISLGAMGFGDRSWRDWVITEEAARPVIARALEAGINCIDTCDFYSNGESERILGNLLWSMTKRDDIVLATKAGNPMAKHVNGRGFSRKHLFEAIDASLRRLKTDYVDLFQTHVWDPTTDLEELVDAFDAIVKQGKALYVGATQMPAWTFVRLASLAEQKGLARWSSMQCEYNACHREAERDLIPFCRDQGIALIPFSPVARGFLADDRRLSHANSARQKSDEYTLKHYHRPDDYIVFEAINSIAKERGLLPVQIAIAWTLAQPGITSPIFGPTTVKHVDDAVAAISLKLTPDEINKIELPYRPRPTRGAGH